MKSMLALVLVCSIAFVSCKPKDADVQKKAETSIKANPDAANVMVTVNDGVATLTGEVKDEATRAAVEDAAKKAGAKSVVNNTTVYVAPAPIIAQDDPLMASVKDATKDYPTVTATVNDGVITLTGSIEKSRLQKLMMALNGLRPKKIDNQLSTN